jgi:hypothetical protein
MKMKNDVPGIAAPNLTSAPAGTPHFASSGQSAKAGSSRRYFYNTFWVVGLGNGAFDL